ncbi:MAG TPA: hypothetical protein DDW50_00845 [Firmicutes bacterium]|nr:hypothetical protein [Bacillota bacterium]
MKARPARGRGVFIFKPSLAVALYKARGLGGLAFLFFKKFNSIYIDQSLLKTELKFLLILKRN